MNRRHFLMTGLCALVYGCDQARTNTALPGMSGVWPSVQPRPEPSHPIPYEPHPNPAPPVAGAPIHPIPRSVWAKAAPDMSDINPMNGVTRLTVHHEGDPEPVYFTDYESTRERMELIREAHRRRGWSDIGYHYVVDRAGRVWQARPIQFQGAHVRDHNEHNVGVMCLGNFDLQTPSDAQLNTLHLTVQQIRRYYKIPNSRIYTHQELNPTRCPGRALQPRVASMRASNMFA